MQARLRRRLRRRQLVRPQAVKLGITESKTSPSAAMRRYPPPSGNDDILAHS